jgi:hypothetical protein
MALKFVILCGLFVQEKRKSLEFVRGNTNHCAFNVGPKKLSHLNEKQFYVVAYWACYCGAAAALSLSFLIGIHTITDTNEDVSLEIAILDTWRRTRTESNVLYICVFCIAKEANNKMIIECVPLEI